METKACNRFFLLSMAFKRRLVSAIQVVNLIIVVNAMINSRRIKLEVVR